MSELIKVKLLSACLADLGQCGYEVEQSTDIDEVERFVEGVGKPYLTPVMSPQANDFLPANCMWLIFRREGRVVALGGARLDDLSGVDAGAFLSRVYSRHYEGGLMKVAGPISDTIKGRACYLGDLYIDPSNRGNLKLLSSGMVLMHLLVSLKWDPDCTYAFLRRQDVDRGAASRYLFSHTIPFSKTFAKVKPPRTNDEVCAVLPRANLLHWITAQSSS